MTTITRQNFNNESDLINHARQGDRNAFDELMNRYGPRMLRTAVKVTGNEYEAEDAVQQAFLNVYRSLHRFRGDSEFSTWMTRITINEAIAIVRKRRKDHVDLNETMDQECECTVRNLISKVENPEAAALRRERMRLVRESLSAVRPSYLKAIKLRLVEDLSVEEIGMRLGLPVNTVKVHLYRGRQAMRQYLEPRLARLAA